MQRLSATTRSALWLLGSSILALAMGCYAHRVLIPYEQSGANSSVGPSAHLGDLYPPWFGTHELLLRHRDPYRQDVTLELHRSIFGTEAATDARVSLFAYPIYVSFLLAPTVQLPFSTVRLIFLWLLGIATAASVWLWARSMDWRPSAMQMGAVALLAVSSVPAIQGLQLQQLGLLVAALVASGFAMAAAGYLGLAGALMAIATIKPQMALLPAAWLLLWATGKWVERKRLILSFAITLALLMAGGEILLPGWIREFGQALVEYRRHAGAPSLLEFLLGPTAGGVSSLVVIATIVIVGIAYRRERAGSPSFAFAAAAMAVAAMLALPLLAPYNDLLLLPTVLLMVRYRRALWSRRGPARGLVIFAIACLSWFWISSIVLLVASLFVPEGIDGLALLPGIASFVLPFSLLALLWPLHRAMSSELRSRSEIRC